MKSKRTVQSIADECDSVYVSTKCSYHGPSGKWIGWINGVPKIEADSPNAVLRQVAGIMLALSMKTIKEIK